MKFVYRTGLSRNTMPAELPTRKPWPKPAPYNWKQPEAGSDVIPQSAATSAKPIKDKKHKNLTLHDWLTVFSIH
jgi:hypothetical protein